MTALDLETFVDEKFAGSTSARRKRNSRPPLGEGALSQLGARLDHVTRELAALGGALDTEEQCDRLWAEQRAIVMEIAAHRATNGCDIVRKLRAVLAMLDEMEDPAILALIRSALADLTH